MFQYSITHFLPEHFEVTYPSERSMDYINGTFESGPVSLVLLQNSKQYIAVLLGLDQGRYCNENGRKEKTKRQKKGKEALM